MSGGGSDLSGAAVGAKPTDYRLIPPNPGYSKSNGVTSYTTASQISFFNNNDSGTFSSRQDLSSSSVGTPGSSESSGSSSSGSSDSSSS
jgi:hypothetical protein